jgi:hypothetical protein
MRFFRHFGLKNRIQSGLRQRFPGVDDARAHRCMSIFHSLRDRLELCLPA